jgi:vancomycin resistance protein YoaR
MLLSNSSRKKKILKWLLIFVAVFLILSVAGASAFFGIQKKYKNKILPGTRLGDINLGGKTKDEAKTIINQKINEINQNGIKFKYNNRETTITPTISSFAVDSSYQIITFNPDQTIKAMFSFGRKNNWLGSFQNTISSLFFKKNYLITYSINKGEIIKILKSSYDNLEIQSKNAELIATSSPNQANAFTFSITQEKLGKIIDYEMAVKKLENNLENLKNTSINLASKTDYPFLYKNECLNIEPEAEKILSYGPLTLTYKDKKWTLEKEKIAAWLCLEKDSKGDVSVSLSPKKITEFLTEDIGPQIEKEPIDARFEIKDGRVSEFQGGQDGLKIKNEEVIQKIKKDFAENGNQTVEITMEEKESAVSAGELNDLGIKEIIGTGHSNFAGSPVNRRHNIKIGAASMNGLLIKPEEEFSLNGALGEVDKESGYLPELVIKGDKTIPEYGGGLCQIGTTVFRSALASGLPITARRSHSYRVSYYEPAGTDAAIYSPWPDVRFLNDTNRYILIQTRIAGDDIYFDFWGTKDGRIVEKTDPVIYNIVKPGPTKIIETLDLPPGETKCTEKAHNGADAYFDYKVIYPAAAGTSTPEIKEERFSSHYVPWQEVCLIGVEKLTEKNLETEETQPGNQENEAKIEEKITE